LPADLKAGIRKLEEPLDNVEVADEDCPPIADMEYRRIGKRTVLLMRENIKPQYRKLYDKSASWVLQRLETVKINKALIPLKGEEIGGLVGLIDNPTINYIYTLGTSPFDGRVFTWVPVGDITVDNTLDIAIVANTIARIIASVMWAIVKAIGEAIFNGVNNGIDYGIRRGIAAAMGGDVASATGSACREITEAAAVGAGITGGPAGVAMAMAPLIACGILTFYGDAIGDTVGPAEDKETGLPIDPAVVIPEAPNPTDYVVRPAFKFRIWPLPSWEFGLIIPWFGAIPLPSGGTLNDVLPLRKGYYLKLLFLFGLEYDIFINPIPTMFFVGDYLLPIGQKVTQSVCLAEDKGHRESDWKRKSGQIEEDAALAEKKGMYEAPEAPNWVLFDKWVLPFSQPFWSPDYENLNEDVPEREPMIQRHDPSRVPDQLDPDDPHYKETVEKTPSYQMTYNRGESDAEKKARREAEAEETATEPAETTVEPADNLEEE